ncbi:MAG: DUF167 domain-containing protein [Candidatus Lernaella stagnicola]|nr:DUF167 domain-containing protein [Candidatus Lernaella stagnicola]
MALTLKSSKEGVLLELRVSPKASADRLGPIHADRLKVAVTSPPDKGKANAHVVKLLAKKLGIAKHQVRVIAGHTDRSKTVVIEGLSAGQVRAKLGL